MLADASRASQPRCRLARVVGTLPEGFSTALYLAALPYRVLLMGRQVWSGEEARQTITYATCRSHPLVEAVGQVQAPPVPERVLEPRLLLNGLGPRVEEPARPPTPRGDEAPRERQYLSPSPPCSVTARVVCENAMLERAGNPRQ